MQAVTREDIEKTLSKRNGAYQRLRRVMDAWAALWCWPLTDADGDRSPLSTSGSRHASNSSAARPEARKNSKWHDDARRGHELRPT